MGGLSTLRVNATWSSLKLGGLRFLAFLPNLCKKPGQKTPVRSQMAPVTVLHWWPLTLPPAGSCSMHFWMACWTCSGVAATSPGRPDIAELRDTYGVDQGVLPSRVARARRCDRIYLDPPAARARARTASRLDMHIGLASGTSASIFVLERF